MRDAAFDKWYKEYFGYAQGEDSPYSYNDVKIAFYSGWKLHKQKVKNDKKNVSSRD